MVTNAKTLEVLYSGVEEGYNNHRQIMSAEFQVTSSFVPTREVLFVRYCYLQADEFWIIVDVSVDELLQKTRPHMRTICQKRPSGCLIQDLHNGTSLITWVEHVLVHDKAVEERF